MKRFLCLLLLAVVAGLALSPQSSEAARARYRITWKHFDGNGGSVDSQYVSHGGTLNSAYHADTSATFRMPNAPDRVTASAADSVAWFTFQFVPTLTNAATAGADSIYLLTQVSFNGKDWEFVTPGQVFYPANEMPTATASVGPALVLSERVSTYNTFFHQYIYAWAALGRTNSPTETAASSGSPTHLQMGLYPFVRFIVVGDWTGIYDGYVEALTL